MDDDEKSIFGVSINTQADAEAANCKKPTVGVYQC